MLNSGERVQGKLDAYTIERALVQGRFGATYQARRDSDQLEVILKSLTLQRDADWRTSEDFERAGDRLRQLNHPGVARYLDTVTMPPRDGVTTLALVQTPAAGESLASRLERDGAQPLDQALAWFEAALELLVALHELKPPLVHGDIDPGNLYLDDDRVTLVDFASARQALLDAPTLASGLAVGALDYAPMEQLLGRIFPASDLYALAMTLLHAVSGKPPAKLAITGGMRVDVKAALGWQASDQLITLVQQLTEPDPDHRLDSARLALERLRALRRAPRSDAEPAPAPLTGAKRGAPKPASQASDGDLSALLHALATSAGALEPIAPGEHWEAAPQVERERLHAFATNLHGTRVVLAHGHEAVLLDGASLRTIGATRFEETARRVAVSRDGRRVAILTGVERLLLYEVEVSFWLRHEVVVQGMWPGNSQLTFSPDGEVVAIADDDQVNLYRFSTGQETERLAIDGQRGLTYAPDGRALFVIGDSGAIVLDGEDQHEEPLTAVAFSPDGRHVALARHGVISFGAFQGVTGSRTWSLEDVALVEAKGAPLDFLRYSPDQRSLLVGSHAGFLAIIELEQRAVIAWQDQATRASSGYRLLEAGFIAGGAVVLAHTTLGDPTRPGSEGAVTGWSLREGARTGDILMRDDKLCVESPQGFFGEVSQLTSAGSGSRVWERPALAAAALLGEDIARRLSAPERARLAEVHLRTQALKRAALADLRGWDPHPVIQASPGLGPVMPEVFAMADEAATIAAQSPRATARPFTEHLVDAARALREQTPAQLEAMHLRLMAARVAGGDEGEDEAPEEVAQRQRRSASADAPSRHMRAPEPEPERRQMPPAAARKRDAPLAGPPPAPEPLPAPTSGASLQWVISAFGIGLLLSLGVIVGFKQHLSPSVLPMLLSLSLGLIIGWLIYVAGKRMVAA